MAVKDKIITNPNTGQSIKFLQTAKDTNGDILEMESTYNAHSKEPAAHYHPYQAEDFLVLAGEVMVRIDRQLKVLKQGDTLHIPSNAVHAMWNNGDEKAVVNWKVRPAMETEFLLETGMGLANDGRVTNKGRPSFLQVVLMANKFSNVYRLPKPSFIMQKIIFFLLTPFAYAAGYRPTYKKYLD